MVTEKRHPALLLAPVTGVLGYIARHPGSYFLLAVRRELLAEGQLDNDLLTLASDEGRSTTNSECQEVKKGLHEAAILLDRAMIFESEISLRDWVSSAVGRNAGDKKVE